MKYSVWTGDEAAVAARGRIHYLVRRGMSRQRAIETVAHETGLPPHHVTGMARYADQLVAAIARGGEVI